MTTRHIRYRLAAAALPLALAGAGAKQDRVIEFRRLVAEARDTYVPACNAERLLYAAAEVYVERGGSREVCQALGGAVAIAFQEFTERRDAGDPDYWWLRGQFA